jgi:hypothetical protein
VLGERIERNLHGLLETLIQAKYSKSRHGLLEKANLSLEVLRFQIRLAKDLRCLKATSYGFASKAIDDIGRQVGSWLWSLVRRGSPDPAVPLTEGLLSSTSIEWITHGMIPDL